MKCKNGVDSDLQQEKRKKKISSNSKKMTAESQKETVETHDN